MPNITAFPNCCTATILYNFRFDNTITNSKLDIDNELYLLYSKLEQQKRNGIAVVVATCTDKQNLWKNFLKSCGFISTRGLSKSRHPENKLFLLHYKLDTLPKNFNEFKQQFKTKNK
jgi:hypothetical protein